MMVRNNSSNDDSFHDIIHKTNGNHKIGIRILDACVVSILVQFARIISTETSVWCNILAKLISRINIKIIYVGHPIRMMEKELETFGDTVLSNVYSYIVARQFNFNFS